MHTSNYTTVIHTEGGLPEKQTFINATCPRNLTKTRR